MSKLPTPAPCRKRKGNTNRKGSAETSKATLEPDLQESTDLRTPCKSTLGLFVNVRPREPDTPPWRQVDPGLEQMRSSLLTLVIASKRDWLGSGHWFSSAHLTECFLKEGIVTPLHKHGMKENSQGLCRLSPGRGLCGIHEFPSTHWKMLLSLKPLAPQNGLEGAVSNSRQKLSSATASSSSVCVLTPLWPSWSLQWHTYAHLTVLLTRILRWPGRGGVLK